MDNKDLIKQYVNIGTVITEYQLNSLSSNLKRSYLRVRMAGISQGVVRLDEFEVAHLKDAERAKYVDLLMSLTKKKFKHFRAFEYELLSEEVKMSYKELTVNNAPFLSPFLMSLLSDEELNQYFERRISGMYKEYGILDTFQYFLGAENKYVQSRPKLRFKYAKAFINHVKIIQTIRKEHLNNVNIPEELMDEFWEAVVERQRNPGKHRLNLWDAHEILIDMPEKYLRPYFTADIEWRYQARADYPNYLSHTFYPLYDEEVEKFVPEDLLAKYTEKMMRDIKEKKHIG
jgi:uncharacterized protein (UPF0305 family)